MELKTSKIQAVERGRPVTDSSDIELLGAENLIDCDDSFKLAIKNKLINNQSNCFCKVFGFKHKFYYSVSLDTMYEIGIGYLEKNKKKIFLKRSLPIFYSDNGTDIVPSYDFPKTFHCTESDFVIVSSYMPRSYIELLPDPNSIITSIGQFLPSSLHVNKNSVIARLNDNIVSVSFEDLFQTEEFQRAVLNITQRS